MSDQEAFDELNAAIRKYQAHHDPDIFIDGWILLTHKRSPEWERNNGSAVGVLASPDLSFIARRGMLDVALVNDRYGDDDDDD